MQCWLPNHLQRPPEEPVEVASQPSLFGDGLLDGLLGRDPLVAEIDQRGEHIVHRRARARTACTGATAKSSSLSFSSTTSRSASFLPTPGMRVSCAWSWPRIACTVRSGEKPLSILMASLGPTPLTVISRSKSRFSSRVEKAEERDLILADLGVDVQRGLRAHRGQRREGWHRDGDVVAHAGGLDDGLAGLLVNELSAQVSDHRSTE